MLILGCDPGGLERNGSGKTGVVVADFRGGQPIVQTATCRSVDEVVDWFQAQTQAVPDAIGIDFRFYPPLSERDRMDGLPRPILGQV